MFVNSLEQMEIIEIKYEIFQHCCLRRIVINFAKFSECEYKFYSKYFSFKIECYAFSLVLMCKMLIEFDVECGGGWLL